MLAEDLTIAGPIRADIFVSLMPEGMVKFLNGIVAPVLALIYCFVLTWKGWTNAMYSLKLGCSLVLSILYSLFFIL